MNIFKTAYHKLLLSLPDSMAVRLHYFRHLRAFPDLSAPRTFNEKIQRRKLYDHDPRLPRLVDKVLVKDYVSERLGPDWIIPTLWAGPALPPRHDRNWVKPYVLKANHGSATNLFIRSDEDWDEIERAAQRWMATRYRPYLREWAYGRIAPQLLVEPYIGDGDILPIDYKLFVFGGRVHYIQVDLDRAQRHRRVFYDRAWRKQEFSLLYPSDTRDVPKPASLEAMIVAAEALVDDIPFARIDFYDVDGAPLFGEMTFYPDSGTGAFSPAEYDRSFGDLWPS